MAKTPLTVLVGGVSETVVCERDHRGARHHLWIDHDSAEWISVVGLDVVVQAKESFQAGHSPVW